MSIDVCRMFVKGEPGSDRKLHRDREGTIREFCIDMSYLYTKVYQHVKKCPTCEPDDVLRQYIANRHVKKFQNKGGIVSSGLVSLAEKYSRLKNKKVSPDVLREFRWRCGQFETLVHDRSRLPSEVVKGLNLIFGLQKEWVEKDGKHFSAERFVRDHLRGDVPPRHSAFLLQEAGRVWDREGSVTPESEAIRDLLLVADVMAS